MRPGCYHIFSQALSLSFFLSVSTSCTVSLCALELLLFSHWLAICCRVYFTYGHSIPCSAVFIVAFFFGYHPNHRRREMHSMPRYDTDEKEVEKNRIDVSNFIECSNYANGFVAIKKRCASEDIVSGLVDTTTKINNASLEGQNITGNAAGEKKYCGPLQLFFDFGIAFFGRLPHLVFNISIRTG